MPHSELQTSCGLFGLILKKDCSFKFKIAIYGPPTRFCITNKQYLLALTIARILLPYKTQGWWLRGRNYTQHFLNRILFFGTLGDDFYKKLNSRSDLALILGVLKRYRSA
ncbi:hypothetical protein PROFUN_09726 [Planoprotostelium fungivorum]|uniref:Uncharacterized protein n=1 Tax=Planoprotostelium fungivorum TaxID=1890364 RepID=A0A2P6NEU4_9EUKA|nr:hypothetical protein PROFUN_09726 [Planoprotostelium fungivorum]